MPRKQSISAKKKSKRRKKTTSGVKVVNNIHINSKSGTRSKKQQRGGVGGYVAPSGASTISHVPLVMNVPAPDSTQRETKWMHALEDIQSDNIALRMQLDEFVKNQGLPNAPNPKDQSKFQTPPSKANFEETLVEAEARGGIRGRIRKDIQVASPVETPVTTRSASLPPQPKLPTTPLPQQPQPPRSGQGIGLQAEDVGPSGGGSRQKQQQKELTDLRMSIEDKLDTNTPLTPVELSRIRKKEFRTNYMGKRVRGKLIKAGYTEFEN